MSSINIVYIFIPNAFSPRLGGIKRKKLIFHPSTSMWFHFFISPSLRANLEFCVLILVVQLKNIPCYCIDVDKMSTTPSGDSALLLSTGHRDLRELSLHVWWVERLAFKSVLRSQFVELLLFPFFFPYLVLDFNLPVLHQITCKQVMTFWDHQIGKRVQSTIRVWFFYDFKTYNMESNC